MQNIIEYARQRSTQQLLTINSFCASWTEWKIHVNTLLTDTLTANHIYTRGIAKGGINFPCQISCRCA